MTLYRCTWQIKLWKIVNAKDRKDAKNIIENIDCQNDGTYQDDSFEHVGQRTLDKDEVKAYIDDIMENHFNDVNLGEIRNALEYYYKDRLII